MRVSSPITTVATVHIKHSSQPAGDDLTLRETGRRPPAIEPGALVVLRSPRPLRGSTAIVRRALPEGWEVEIRSPAGTPMHLVVPAKQLLLV